MFAFFEILFPAALLVGLAQEAPSQADPEPQYLGLYAQTLGEMVRPEALAYAQDGTLWVADADLGRMLRFDPDGAPTGGFDWGHEQAPGGLEVARDGSLWVSLRWKRQVRHVSAQGESLGQLSKPNPDSPRGGFLDPRGVALTNESIWVADAGWGRIDEFAADGTWKRSIGEGQLKHPEDVCVDSSGRLLVADTGHSRVCAFAPSGELLTSFGEWGWFPGLFSDPTAIESHGDRIYVADRENQRVQVFDLQGQPIYRIGLHAILPREGEGTLHYPAHLALGKDGQRLALAEPMDGRVQLFGMGQGTSPPTIVNRPTDRQPAPHYGTHWDLGAGYLAIPEPETHSIRIYDLRRVGHPAPGEQAGTPTLVTEVGGFGTELGRYSNPAGLHIGGDPLTLLVCDLGNGRLVETGLDLSQKDPLGYTLTATRVKRAMDLGAEIGGWKHPWTPRPIDVERAADGTTFVLCELAREVLVFGTDWKLRARFGATPEHPWLHPTALAWDESSGRLFVCDGGQGLVHVYGKDGGWRTSFGAGHLRRPSAVAFDQRGQAWVVDRQGCTLTVFDRTGEWVREQGQPGLDRDSFFGPTDVDVDERGHIYILDHGNHRGMVLNGDGTWFHAFGSRLYTKPARLPESDRAPGGEDSE